MNVETQMQSRQVSWLYLALGLTQAVHSVEEVLTGLWKNLPAATGWVNARVSFLPVKEWSAEGFAAANLIIVAVLLGFSPFPFQNHTWAWKVVRIVAVVEMLNGLLHMTAALLRGGYFPGCGSAIVLFLLGLAILLKTRKSHGQ